MGEVVDSVKYPSLPSNYITLQWLKDQQRKQQENEKKEQYPFPQDHNGKGLVGKASKLKEVRGKAKEKKKMGYFVKRVERDMAKEETMSVENGGRESYKEVEEVNTVCVVEERTVDRGSEGERCGVGFRGKKNSRRKRVDVKDRTNEKVRMGGAFCAYGDKEVASGCKREEVVGERNVDREIAGRKCRVGFRGKKYSGRKMADFGEVSDKADRVEQSGQEHNAEKEKVSVDEKVKVSGAFRAYSDKEVEQVATVCAVEVVGENKLDKEIAGQKCRVGFMGKKNSGRRMSDGVSQVSDKADKAECVEQSGHEHNAKKEEVLVDMKERTNEKVRVRGAFRPYGDKSIDVPLIDSEAGLKMKIETDLGDLSLSDRRYGHGRSRIGVYDNKWRYGNSRRYEPRKMLKQKDSSFVWIKKGESSNANVAEIEIQVDFSSQSTSQSKLCSQ